MSPHSGSWSSCQADVPTLYMQAHAPLQCYYDKYPYHNSIIVALNWCP
nr:MAG TPA: hypothetical protein [Inoviridae sp.]